MSQKYHVKPNGTVGVCKAERGRCPYQSAPHFNSEQEAQAYIDEQNEKEHGILPEVKRMKANNTAIQTTIKRLEKQRLAIEKSLGVLKDYIETYGDVESLHLIRDGRLFFNSIRYQSAQSKAPQFESFLENKFGWKKIPASLDRGDFIRDGEYVELKTSFSNKAMKLNIRQIRPWQKNDKYVCIFIDDANEHDKSVAFELTHDEMVQEIELLGGFTHGTKEANKKNKNNEYSITIDINSNNKDYQRWVDMYGIPEFLESILDKGDEA